MSTEERIRFLCPRAVAAEGSEFEGVATELHAALKAHVESLRAMAVLAFLRLPRPSHDRSLS